MVAFTDAVFDRARTVATSASGQRGPLEFIAAWLLIIGFIVFGSTVGLIGTAILFTLIVPIITLGVIWVVARNVSDQSIAGYSVQEVALVAGPLLAVVFVLAGSWPFALLAIVATVVLAAV